MSFVNLTIRSVLLLLVSNNVFANASSSKEQKYFDMKCYVELVGGAHNIYRNYDVPLVQKKHFKKHLMQQTTSNKQSQNTIYKVKECTEMHNNFKDEQARILEEIDKDLG